jgi:hypothetical protein
MLRGLKIRHYALAVAAALGVFVAALAVFFPVPSESAQTVESRRGSVSPRIAAWQERVAEEKLYAEREARRLEAEKAADLAARQEARERALAKKHPPKVLAQDTRDNDLARERAQAAVHKAKRTAQRQRQFDSEAAFAYAPQPDRTYYNNIYSAMREMRGGN